MYIQCTRVLYSVVIKWQSNPRISQFNSPYNKFTSFCSSLYTLHEVFIMLLLLKTFIVFEEIRCASFKYKQLVERKHDIGRFWETLGDFGRLWETLEDFGRLWETLRDFVRLWETVVWYLRLCWFFNEFTEFRLRFNVYDRDCNGVVKVHDLLTILVEMGMTVAIETLDEMMFEADLIGKCTFIKGIHLWQVIVQSHRK